MVCCVAYGCGNRPTNKSQRQLILEKTLKISFHKFPKDIERRNLWIKEVGRKNWNPTKNSCICSVHFEEKQMDRTSVSNIVRLRENAIPTIFDLTNEEKITSIKKSKSPTTRKTLTLKRGRRKKLGDNIPGQTSSTDKTSSNSEEIQSKDEDIQKRTLNKNSKSPTTCATPPKRRRRKQLLVSSDEKLEEDDIPGQTTSTNITSSNSEEIQSMDEHIQGHPVKNSSNRKGILRSNKRQILSNSESQRNQITDFNTSDVKAKKRCLDKNAVASSNLTTSSKLQAASSKNAPTIIRKRNSQMLKRKSSPPRNIQKKQLVDHVGDEFDIFAKYIAIQLRQLPYYNALQCQEKIKRIINQERFIAQESRKEEIEAIIIKKDPGLREGEVLSHPLSGPGTIEATIKEEPGLMEDEYPISGRETNQRIINQEPAISDDVLSLPVSGQKTNKIIINKEPAITENELSNTVSGPETTLNEEPALSGSYTVLSQETTINEELVLSDDDFPHSVSGHDTIQTIIYHMPIPLDLIKTENLSSDTQSVTTSD